MNKDMNDMTVIDEYKKLDTAAISDALDSLGISGGLVGIKPVSQGTMMVGYAYTIKYSPIASPKKGFFNAGNYIDNVPKGSVVVIDNNGREDCTSWGDILTHKAISSKIAGTVVWGSVRDVMTISQRRYPLFSRAVFMQSGKNRVIKTSEQTPVEVGGVTVNPGDLVVGDDNGCVVIPSRHISNVLEKAKNVEMTERKILSAIRSGIPLEKARNDCGYDSPWNNRDAGND